MGMQEGETDGWERTFIIVAVISGRISVPELPCKKGQKLTAYPPAF